MFLGFFVIDTWRVGQYFSLNQTHKESTIFRISYNLAIESETLIYKYWQGLFVKRILSRESTKVAILQLITETFITESKVQTHTPYHVHIMFTSFQTSVTTPKQGTSTRNACQQTDSYSLHTCRYKHSPLFLCSRGHGTQIQWHHSSCSYCGKKKKSPPCTYPSTSE